MFIRHIYRENRQLHQIVTSCRLYRNITVNIPN